MNRTIPKRQIENTKSNWTLFPWFLEKDHQYLRDLKHNTRIFEHCQYFTLSRIGFVYPRYSCMWGFCHLFFEELVKIDWPKRIIQPEQKNFTTCHEMKFRVLLHVEEAFGDIIAFIIILLKLLHYTFNIWLPRSYLIFGYR